MKYYVLLLSILCCSFIKGQENYTQLTRKALETMWSAEDSVGYRKALNMYENAFQKFPDSIDGLGLYKSSVLASNLKEFDKAFEYLTPLAEMITDENGYPGWRYIIGKYAKKEYENLHSDPRWQKLEKKAVVDKQKFFEKLKKSELEFFSISEIDFSKLKGKKLYAKLKEYNPFLPKLQKDYSISLQINDSIRTSYSIHLPGNYTPRKRYPLLVFLHGAVFYSTLSQYQITSSNLIGWNRYYTKYAERDNVILVFIDGSKKYNWMYPDVGFFMVPEMVEQIKKTINVDDNKIFITGHSNGATGSFAYLMKQSTLFAGFYGFNTHPKVYTGGTFVENIKNRSFTNFSTDQDYYYPPNANDTLTKLMKSIKADYKDYRYNGFPHWFPKFDESEPAYQILFEDLKKRKRNPYPKKITWEFDDDTYGNIDWLSSVKLDTLSAKAEWHQEKNFTIHKWLKYNENDSLITEKVDRKAFDFPRKSGKIVASYKDNVFEMKTSCIKSFRIYISPEMVNLRKEVKVYVNDKLISNKKVRYDTNFMIENFKERNDRKQLWVNYIDITLENLP